MKRVIDLPYYSFTVYSAAKTGICVKCPICGGAGMVRVDGKAYFKCFDCGSVKEKSLSHYRTSVHALQKLRKVFSPRGRSVWNLRRGSRHLSRMRRGDVRKD